MSCAVARGMHINSTSTTGVSSLPLTAHTSTSDSPDAQWQWPAALVVFQLCFYDTVTAHHKRQCLHGGCRRFACKALLLKSATSFKLELWGRMGPEEANWGTEMKPVKVKVYKGPHTNTKIKPLALASGRRRMLHGRCTRTGAWAVGGWPLRMAVICVYM
jgi:hypothetical protein